jgi:membrane-bound lytic murein transglycosylase B
LNIKKIVGSACFIGLLGLQVNATSVVKTSKPIVDPKTVINELVEKYQFDRTYVEASFAELKPNQKIIKLMTTPAEGKPWYKYRPIFLQDKRISEGVKFMQEHKSTLDKVSSETGVPAEIITAIIGVETYYGRIKGNFSVLDALYTLGFHYPSKKSNRNKRAAFFRKELVHYFRLAKEQDWDITAIKGSYAGAMGYGQFMPSSYNAYAKDFENDGRKNLIGNPRDAIASVANYFIAHGWQKDMPVAELLLVNTKHSRTQKSLKLKQDAKTFVDISSTVKTLPAKHKAGVFSYDSSETAKDQLLAFENFYTITRYNHSSMYARVVWELSQELKKSYVKTL